MMNPSPLEGATRARPALLSLAITTALFAIVLSAFSLGYRTNDDPAMALRAAGVSKTAAPSPYLMNSNMVLGHALAGLYARWPAAPWYGLYLLTCHVLAVWSLLYAVLRTRASPTRLGLFLLYFVTLELNHVVRLQFTTTAFVVGQGGVFLLLAWMLSAEPRRPLAWAPLILSMGLLLLGGLVRWRSLQLVLLLGIPALAVCLATRFDPRLLRRFAAAGLALAVVLVSLHQWDRAQYRADPAWERMYQYKKAKAQIIDFKNVYYDETTRDRFDRVGWSENDFAMVQSWFFADYDHFSLARMRQLLAEFPPHKRDLANVRDVLPEIIDPTWHGTVVIVVALMLFARRRSTLVIHLASAALAVGGIVWLAYFMKAPPPRVYLSLFSFLAALGVFFADADVTIRRADWRLGLSLLALIAALGAAIRPATANVRWGRLNVQAPQSLEQVLAAIDPRPHELYVIWGGAFPWQWTPPFANLRSLYGGFNTVGIGMSLASPLTQERLREYQITDLYTGLLKDDVYLLLHNPGGRPPRTLALYRQYMKEHYDLVVRHALLHRNALFGVYKLTPVASGARKHERSD